MKFFPHVKPTVSTGKNIPKEIHSFIASQLDFLFLKNLANLTDLPQSFVSLGNIKISWFD